MSESDSQAEFGPVPRGLEVLISKASVDPEFRAILLGRRAAAAAEIGLELDPSEAMMLEVAPTAQLKAIIAGTSVPMAHRRAFLGKAAAAMLAAVAAMEASVAEAGKPIYGAPGGIRVEVAPPSPPAPPQPPATVESLVIDSVARTLSISKDQITAATTFEQLQAMDQRREMIRQALEKELHVTLPRQTFDQLGTIGEAIDLVELSRGVGPAVVLVIARELAVRTDRVTWRASLVDDLEATPAQVAQLRRELASQLRVYLDWDAFRQLATVGEVIDTVATAVRLREQAEAQKKQIPTSRGIRPDYPIRSFGIRPGSSGGR